MRSAVSFTTLFLRACSDAAIPVRRALGVAAVVMLAACAGDDPIGTINNGSIRGTVTDNTGATVANATVALTGNGQSARTTSSAADGAYTFADVPAGTYALAVTPPSGYTAGTQGTASITVASGAEANPPALVLQRVVTGSIKGVVNDASGAGLANIVVALTGNAQTGRTTLTGTNGAYTFTNVVPGTYTLTVMPPGGYISAATGTASVTVAGDAEASATAFVLTRDPVAPGQWGIRATMLENNSEFALAEANGKLYVLGGYPPWQGPNRTQRTVQVYDIATDRWQMGPLLPQPNNHGMAASVNGKIYMIGGQTTDDQNGLTAVNSLYELDPATGVWVEKAPMPTARSGGVAVVSNGKIYVAGGRVPRGNDFAVYDPATNAWEVLPNLPSQRNHIAGAAINGRIHIIGGRLGNGLSPLKSDAHEVYDPQTRTWTTAATMLSARSGINSVMARGCFHVWGGEAPTGMTPQHEYYDPRTNTWSSLSDMPIPIHGVVGSAFVDGLIWVTGGGTQVGGSFGSLLNQVHRPAVSCE